MPALVIYDSFFGNTEQIAQAVAQGLGTQARAVRVGDVKARDLAGVDLLVVGSPTRGFRPTPAISGFLNALPADTLKGVQAAAFDTGIAVADIKPAWLRFLIRLGGYAAKPIAGLLQKKGATLDTLPEGFFVLGEKGPLKSGEVERAAVWAAQLVRRP